MYCIFGAALLCLFSCVTGTMRSEASPVSVCKPASRYLNPQDCVAASAGDCAYVALAGPCTIASVDLKQEKLMESWPLPDTPTGLALSSDGSRLAVTLGDAMGRVAVLSTKNGDILRSFPAGFSPKSPVYVQNGEVLAVCNRFTNSVGFYRVNDGTLLDEVKVTRDPYAAVLSRDGSKLFVGCLLPALPATSLYVAATIDLIDIDARKVQKSIKLPNGSASLRSLAISPDGNYLFAAHIIGHHQVPTNQLERGWMNANALSVIDVKKAERIQTVLLDDTTKGAANPWGVAVTGDGTYLAVTHAGTHEISRIPLKPFLEIVLRGYAIPEKEKPSGYGPGTEDGLEIELQTMMSCGRDRIRMPGESPRAVTVAGSNLLVCEYFSGTLTMVHFGEENATRIRPRQILLGRQPEMDPVRRGELLFSDARICFQGWQSCLSCHPDVRTDGLNWDLLNDGIGNPKQTKSLLGSHATPPAMGRGIRATAEVAVRSGIRYIQFAQVIEENALAIDAYLKSLRPLPSPYLKDGQLSKKAQAGKVIFERVGCAACHSGPYYTNLKSYPIPFATGLDKGESFDTTGLVEIWRTAPYLYDGRAATMPEALKIHGNTSDLNDEELDALSEYVLSL